MVNAAAFSNTAPLSRYSPPHDPPLLCNSIDPSLTRRTPDNVEDDVNVAVDPAGTVKVPPPDNVPGSVRNFV